MKAYEKFVTPILDMIESGEQLPPWSKPWNPLEITESTPRSVHGRPYMGGLNRWALDIYRQVRGYTSPTWITYAQMKKRGGKFKSDAKGHGVCVLGWFKKSPKKAEDRSQDEDEDKGSRLFPRAFYVFNLSLTDLPEIPLDLESVKPAGAEFLAHPEALVARYLLDDGPSMDHDGGDRAYYRPSEDGVHLPARSQFHSTAGYYSTVFHELRPLDRPRNPPQPIRDQRGPFLRLRVLCQGGTRGRADGGDALRHHGDHE